MSIYQWLCLLGIPSIIVGMLGFVKVWIKQMRAVKLGLQAILRDRLLQAYHYYKEQGYASYDEKQNVVNLYTQYEALGPNGIMQRKHETFLALPEEPVNNPN
ncbi:MAG: hypothetical protein II008_09600 [Oscillospiraceae bacterium]|nr:hypothetical protein [Oscillospiraceae bacterium]